MLSSRRHLPRGRPSKSGGKGTHFTKAEKEILLDCIDEILPIGPIDWDVVTAMFNGRVDESRERDKASLTRQFGTLWKVNMPTGNPNIPPAVKRAKHLRYKIQGKSGTVNADEMSKESGEVAGEEEEGLDREDIETGELQVLEEEANASAEATNISPGERELQRQAKTEMKLLARKKTQKTPKAKTPRASPTSETDKILEALIATEKLAAAREERREKRD